ncbi:HotDog domain-containing protein [Schizothecium vesticola]|uniref:HotDog domain-containing protein n=1 Tax=Schizothecium vesticola TaxID=314040 RepID=A0AA40FD04_9PEZI|nr:HotDog domain-containing protein [Schizothecium vesticola]
MPPQHPPLTDPHPEVAHFLSLPWCRHLLTASPTLTIHPCITRTPKPHHEEALMATTLNSPRTISAFVLFYEPPPPTTTGTPGMLTSLSALLTLGPLLNGWRGLCHGGAIMTVLDEVLGQIPALNRASGALPDRTTLTAYLNTRFEAPVRTDEDVGGKTVVVRARLTRREGRKMWIEGAMEEEGGRVLARAEALFVQIKEKL